LHHIKLALTVPKNGTGKRHFHFVTRLRNLPETGFNKFFGSPDPSEFTAYSIRVSGLATGP
jgi:hypothetical protein